MRHTITTSHLIRFIYGEVSYLERMAIQQAMKTDANLRQEYQSLMASQNQLDEVSLSPSTSTIQNILNYSSSSRLEETF